MEIKACLDAAGARYREIDDDDALCEQVAELLADGKVVAWFQGRMEFGPRALGSRSILGDPRSEHMQSTMNRKIKFRESFRPFAPSVLEESCVNYFAMRDGDESPYMLVVAPVREAHRRDVEAAQRKQRGFAMLGVPRSDVPAVTHVDSSARVQTVDPIRHPRFHKLIAKFRDKTGCPMLINTSFNVRGEPIVCSPSDAYRCFMATEIDALVIENFVVTKSGQPVASSLRGEAYATQFVFD